MSKNSNALVDFVKLKVKSLLILKGSTQELIDKMLSDVGVYVRQGIIAVQRNQAIPPREYQVELEGNVRNHYNRTRKDVLYQYFDLPEDFGTLVSFRFFPNTGDESDDYTPAKSEYNLVNEYNETGVGKYKIKEATALEGRKQLPRIGIYPVPNIENATLVISYYTDGRLETIDYLDENYWSMIADEVLYCMGIGSKGRAEESKESFISSKKMRDGKSSINKSPRSRTITFFGGRNFKL